MTQYFESKWGEEGPRPEPDGRLNGLFATMTTVQEIFVECAIDPAWQLISTVERIGEFSPECVEAYWLDDVTDTSIGRRFEGRNRRSSADAVMEWIRLCIVETWDPPHHFAWAVGDRFDGSPATHWSFKVVTEASGVIIRQNFWHAPDGISGIRTAAEEDFDKAPAIVAFRLEELRSGMAQTLERMKSVLESAEPV